MSITGYQIVAWQQHWRIIDGCYYRDALAIRTADGALREISVREDQ